MNPDLKQLLTIDDVCALVKVSPHTVRSWLAAGTIPSLRAGQLVRFDPDELAAWLRVGGRESADSTPGGES